MPIFPRGYGHWRGPSGDRPFASVGVLGDGDHEITIRPGADVADLADALDEISADAVFVTSYGDVDAVLLFRADPPAPAGVPATVPDAPRPPVTVGGGAS